MIYVYKRAVKVATIARRKNTLHSNADFVFKKNINAEDLIKINFV